MIHKCHTQTAAVTIRKKYKYSLLLHDSKRGNPKEEKQKDPTFLKSLTHFYLFYLSLNKNVESKKKKKKIYTAKFI